MSMFVNALLARQLLEERLREAAAARQGEERAAPTYIHVDPCRFFYRRADGSWRDVHLNFKRCFT